jgi:hypothetical protein
MKKENKVNRLIAFLFGVTLMLISAPVQGQQKDSFEVGAQFTSLTPGAKREVGVGGRFGYNVTDHLAIETEVNYFPSSSTRGFAPGGNILQGQFGLKAGKRWNRFGVFAKARPGFVSFDGAFVVR